MAQILLTILLALALDRFIPNRAGFQVFSWYSDWVESIEQRFNGGIRSQGLGAVVLAVVPVLLAVLVGRYIFGQFGATFKFIFDVVVLYFCLNLYRLGNIASDISANLNEGNVYTAAELLEELTSKAPSELSESVIARNTIEAVLKQGNTLVIAPLFWFILLGPAGAVMQRLAAILDRLWGHHSKRFIEFGWAAARLNDLLDWLPARVTALSYAIMGSFEDALHCWRRHARMWSDINSGPLLASGFGAMHMVNCDDETQGTEFDQYTSVATRSITAEASDVHRALALLWRVLLFWLAVAILMSGAHLAGLFTH